MSEQLPIWLQILAAKTPETWGAVLGGTIYVWYKSGAATRLGKAIEAIVSGIMSMSISPDMATYTDMPSPIVHFVVAVGGFLVLDVFVSILLDKSELTNIILAVIKRWLKIDGK